VLFLFHAPQKVLGWWGSEQFPLLSLRGLASVTELVTSPLIAAGWLTPWASLAAACEMAGAYVAVHLPRGGWPIENRGEVAILYFLIFVYIGVRGGGAYSVDARHGHRSIASGGLAMAVAASLLLVVCIGAARMFTLDLSARGGVDSTTRGVRVFVTNEGSGTLSVIDPATSSVVETVPLGKRPRGVKLSPDGKSLYVALSGSPNAPPGVDRRSLPPPDRAADGIGEVDTQTLRLKRIIRAGDDPEQLDVSPSGTRLYVANEETAQLTVVDVPSGRVVATVNVGDEPEGVAIRPDGRVVYVTSEADGDIFVIDTATNALIAKIAVGDRPRSIGFLPDGSRAYVTVENDAALTVIDAVKHRFVELVPLAEPGTPRPRPMGLAVRADGSAVYVTAGASGRLLFFNPATNQPVASLAVGQRPWGVALMPDQRTAYTANGPSNDVSVIDLQSHQVLTRIPVGDRPWGVAVANSTDVP
jgi:YVTN family beta-propeller protein